MRHNKISIFAITLLLVCTSVILDPATAAEVAGVKAVFVDDSATATLAVEALDKYKLQINIDPRAEREPLTLQVELPKTGRNTWPFIDVKVLDSNGDAVVVRRGGIDWHKLLITVPPVRSTYVVHAVDPPGAKTLFREAERHVTDSETGLSATICRWHNGRRAALSLRFDDSHPTHLSKAIPILNEYKFRGTFMVNPGGHPPTAAGDRLSRITVPNGKLSHEPGTTSLRIIRCITVAQTTMPRWNARSAMLQRRFGDSFRTRTA